MKIDGETLTIDQVANVAWHWEKVELAPASVDKIRRARVLVEKALEAGAPVYGINTGFGQLKEVTIPPGALEALQENLILSHAASVGEPLPEDAVRAMILLRANALARGCSGVRLEIVEFLIELLNRHVHPMIPSQGSVGASGDLALLAHMALTLMGKGDAYLQGILMSSSEALLKADLQPMTLRPKEGLALINGTQAMCALGCLLVRKAQQWATLADIIGATTLEAVKGTNLAFLPSVHAQKPHPGQQASARNLTRLTDGSRLMQSHRDCMRVQDCYSLRCMPQVHGASRDAIDYARRVLEIEINSTTDNPVVLPDEGAIVSAGHFHGQPVAMAMDFLAMAIAELGSIAERRIERLVNPHYSNGLPPFLSPDPGLNSGYMIAQYTAASLASENKGLAHPACVDSIPTSAGQEDHVSMGMTSARKAWRIMENVEHILAIELMCAVQGLDFRKLKPGPGIEAARRCLREHLPYLKEDRIITGDIQKTLRTVRDGSLARAVEKETGALE